MSDLVFYTNPQSRGRIVRWMLEEVGQQGCIGIVNLGSLATYLVNYVANDCAVGLQLHILTWTPCK